MWKKLIASIFFFGIVFAHAQSDSLHAEIQVDWFAVGKDTVMVDTSKLITMRELGLTKIITLGQLKGIEYGIQIELIRSSLGKEPVIIVGKAFFQKKETEWKVIEHSLYYDRAEFVTSPVQSQKKELGAFWAVAFSGITINGHQRYFNYK